MEKLLRTSQLQVMDDSKVLMRLCDKRPVGFCSKERGPKTWCFDARVVAVIVPGLNHKDTQVRDPGEACGNDQTSSSAANNNEIVRGRHFRQLLRPMKDECGLKVNW